jgi:prepilin-type N-terminal cleavage/methylation domain-containing protein
MLWLEQCGDTRGEPTMTQRSGHSTRRPRAFTLIELLIVVGILALLLAISVVVGSRIVGSGKQRVTEGILKALDTSLSEYIHSEGHNPPALVTDPRDNTHVIPVADAALPPDPAPQTPPQAPPTLNSVGLYLLQAKSVPAAESAVQGIDPKYLRTYDPDSQGMNGAFAQDKQPALLSAFDGWGNPIRYVHPAYQGAWPSYGAPSLLAYTSTDRKSGALPPGKTFTFTQQQNGIRRNASSATADVLPDADGGMVMNNRPYFYSVGPDGHPGYGIDAGGGKVDFNLDNVYLAVPKYQR